MPILTADMHSPGTTLPIRAIIPVQVTRARPVTSPAYDDGATEAELRARWSAYDASRPVAIPHDE